MRNKAKSARASKFPLAHFGLLDENSGSCVALGGGGVGAFGGGKVPTFGVMFFKLLWIFFFWKSPLAAMRKIASRKRKTT